MIFTLPSLQATKEKNISYRKAVISNEGAQRELKKIEESIKTFRQSNDKILTSFDTPYDKEIIKKGLEANIESVVIKNIKESTLDSYNLVSMEVEGLIDSPKQFHQTLESLNNSKYIAKATFPISFDKQGQKIKLVFMLKIYSLPSKN
jgi:vacuolar-type H+-ATPase subunit E/Vma4